MDQRHWGIEEALISGSCSGGECRLSEIGCRLRNEYLLWSVRRFSQIVREEGAVGGEREMAESLKAGWVEVGGRCVFWSWFRASRRD